MLAVANRLKCEVHFATSALTKPSFQPLKILYIQQGNSYFMRFWDKYHTTKFSYLHIFEQACYVEKLRRK